MFRIMLRVKLKYLVCVAFLGCCLVAGAWEWKGVSLTGSVQSDMLVPQWDKGTGAEKKGDFLNNTYADLLLQSKYIDAGARLEFLEYSLPGFEKDFEGWGVPHLWMKAKLGKVELTGGTFYDQFGSGFIFRTYEERSLGIDNALLGGRVVVKPYKGITVKALSGVQRRYWEWNKSLVSGADAEIHLDEWIPRMQQSDTRLMMGFSWVNKYEKKEVIRAPGNLDYRYNLPKFVNAWDFRVGVDKGPWSLLAEYAEKSQDPSFDNGYRYDKGRAAMVSGSYSKKGLSLLFQVKRSENMAFRSRRKLENLTSTSSYINHLPAFTQDQTYALAALYPYATQLADGEMAYQAEAGYNFKRKTALGGKYGMNVKVNFSHVRWKRTVNYQDIDVQLTKKLSKSFKLSLMYMNQRYNQFVVKKHSDENGRGDMINSNIFIADGKYQFSPKVTLRGELQYLTTGQDQGDWAYGLLELSLAPHWMITVSDMWNCGGTKLHYYQGLVTYNVKQHRIQAGYGRTRKGLNCSGGVCREVPASTGWTLSYNYNF